MRIALLLLSMAALLSGCEANVSDCRSDEPPHWMDIQKFSFEGHDYIRFGNSHGGVVPDPKCKACKK